MEEAHSPDEELAHDGGRSCLAPRRALDAGEVEQPLGEKKVIAAGLSPGPYHSPSSTSPCVCARRRACAATKMVSPG